MRQMLKLIAIFSVLVAAGTQAAALEICSTYRDGNETVTVLENSRNLRMENTTTGRVAVLYVLGTGTETESLRADGGPDHPELSFFPVIYGDRTLTLGETTFQCAD